MIRKIVHLSVAFSIVALMVGCSAKPQTEGTPSNPKYTSMEVEDDPSFAPKKTKIRPIIGSKSTDAKMVRDFGYIQKTWIAPYVNDNNNLVASHDIYVVVKEPKWVVGESLPIAKKKGLTALKAPTFQSTISPDELEGAEVTNDTVKEFINNIGKLNKEPAAIIEKMDASVADGDIKNYLNGKRGNK